MNKQITRKERKKEKRLQTLFCLWQEILYSSQPGEDICTPPPDAELATVKKRKREQNEPKAAIKGICSQLQALQPKRRWLTAWFWHVALYPLGHLRCSMIGRAPGSRSNVRWIRSMPSLCSFQAVPSPLCRPWLWVPSGQELRHNEGRAMRFQAIVTFSFSSGFKGHATCLIWIWMYNLQAIFD